MALPVKVNYLTNKELLSEIHKSKNSFSYYTDPQFSSYDHIVDNLDEINDELIQVVREAKAKKLTKVERQRLKDQGLKNHQIKVEDFDPLNIPVEGIVWRVMTHEHIPLEEGRVKNPKRTADNHVRLNFAPFKHFVIEENEFKEVGRSHWKNALENGQFCQDHGKISNRLALMFMKLVERYGQRGNWRGYCVDESTEALTKRGWIGVDDITEDDTILSYNGKEMSWSAIHEVYRGQYEGKMFKITNQSVDMLITPNHKLVTSRGLQKVEFLKESDQLILMGEAEVGNQLKVFNDDLVELAGWIFTEGCYDTAKDGFLRCITIYQNEGANAQKIRDCLNRLDYAWTGGHGEGNLAFRISREDSRKFVEVFPKKIPTMEFICQLTADQREILINTMILGDGWDRTNNNRSYAQKCPNHIDVFQALCAISGIRSRSHLRKDISFGKETETFSINLFSKRKSTTRVECLNFHGGKNSGKESGMVGKGKLYHPNTPTEDYNGRVWCPVTDYGCFLARRNGKIYLTGNTYLDEMRSQALLQLSSVGLQINEARSDNPFAYYTVTVSNAFTRVLNLEKRNQNIRDDLLVMHGVTPSITRQIDNSLAQRALANGEVPEQKKLVRRGPPKKVVAADPKPDRLV